MSIALGLHVGVEEVSAALVDADLPELGPVSTRVVSVASAPGGVADAVTTMLGIMRVQAARNDLHIMGSAAVCDSIALCGIVRDALAAHRVSDVVVVDAGDPRLDAEVPMGIAAALFGAVAVPGASSGEVSADGLEARDDVGGPSGGDRSNTSRSARPAMIGVGIAVLAALSGATVWAMSASGSELSPAVGTADAVVDLPSSATAVADPTGAPLGSPSVPTADTGTLEASQFGPLPVGEWSEQPSSSLLPGSAAEAAPSTGGSVGGGSVGSGGPDRGIVGGGGNSSDASDGEQAGGGRTPTDDPKPKPKPTPKPQPQPGPEPESPDTEPESPDTDSPSAEVPTATEPASTPEEPAAEPKVPSVE